MKRPIAAVAALFALAAVSCQPKEVTQGDAPNLPPPPETVASSPVGTPAGVSVGPPQPAPNSFRPGAAVPGQQVAQGQQVGERSGPGSVSMVGSDAPQVADFMTAIAPMIQDRASGNAQFAQQMQWENQHEVDIANGMANPHDSKTLFAEMADRNERMASQLQSMRAPEVCRSFVTAYSSALMADAAFLRQNIANFTNQTNAVAKDNYKSTRDQGDAVKAAYVAADNELKALRSRYGNSVPSGLVAQ